MPVGPAGGLCGAEPADQVVESSEVDGEPCFAGGDRERDGDQGLSDSGQPEESDVGLGPDELEGSEVGLKRS